MKFGILSKPRFHRAIVNHNMNFGSLEAASMAPSRGGRKLLSTNLDQGYLSDDTGGTGSGTYLGTRFTIPDIIIMTFVVG